MCKSTKKNIRGVFHGKNKTAVPLRGGGADMIYVIDLTKDIAIVPQPEIIRRKPVGNSTKVQQKLSFCARNYAKKQRRTEKCIKKRKKWKLKCAKRAKNEQGSGLLARIDLNSSQKCNKIKTETEEKEGHKSRHCAFALFLGVRKKT